MYSPVSKYSPDARKKMTYRSTKSKSCGYYMRIVFFFSSLIQSLIIVSLVLFLVYGKQQDTASASRIHDLEMRFSQLTLESMSLKQQRMNLTNLLNITVQDKTRNEFDLVKMRLSANASYFFLVDMEKRLQQCNFERMKSRGPPEVRTPMNHFQPFQPVGGCNCGLEMETCKAKLELIQNNFTQTAMKMQMDMDQMAMERDRVNLEAIQLRRDKFLHEKAIELYQIKCKDEFINSFSGISNVSKAFLSKIESLFQMHSFQISCPKQKEYLEQIRTNCTNLSEEVVRKFQNYLDNLGSKVSMSAGNISVLTAENIRMTRDYNLCSQNRTGLIREHRQKVDRMQLKNDEEKEKLLKEKIKLNGDIEVLESSVKYKNSELDHLKQQLKHLNMSCIPRTGGGLFPRPVNQPGSTWGLNTGSSSSSSSNSGGLGQFNRNSYGSSSSQGSQFGSAGSNSGVGSTNTGFNKPSSTGLGSSSLGSNNGVGSSGLNKPGSSNQGSSSQFGSSFGSSSSGTGLNKQTSTGLGSSLFGSTFGSSNNPSSSSSNQNKFGFGSSGATGASSSNSNFGSSSSNLGSSNSNFGSSNTNLGSSSSKFGSSSSNLGSSNSNLGSSSSSLGSNFGSSSNSNLGSSSSKTTSNSRGSSLFGSSSSSSSSLGSSSSSSQNKQSSSSSKNSPSSSSSSSGSSPTTNKGFGWWLGGASSSSSSSSSNSNSDQSKLGSNQGRGSSSSGNGLGSFGSGRSNTFSFTGPITYNDHIRDLLRMINPPVPEEKPELSRMMG